MPWRRRAARVAVNLHELRGQPANFAFLPPCRHNLDGTAFTAVTKRYALTGQIKTGYEVRSSRRCPVPGVCPRASTHRTHARGFPRSTDLRCNQTRASTGSTVSPRSREAGRRPSSSLNSANWAARAGSLKCRQWLAYPLHKIRQRPARCNIGVHVPIVFRSRKQFSLEYRRQNFIGGDIGDTLCSELYLQL